MTTFETSVPNIEILNSYANLKRTVIERVQNSNHDFELLRLNYKTIINSPRRMSYIMDVAGLVSVLEKRSALNEKQVHEFRNLVMLIGINDAVIETKIRTHEEKLYHHIRNEYTVYPSENRNEIPMNVEPPLQYQQHERRLQSQLHIEPPQARENRIEIPIHVEPQREHQENQRRHVDALPKRVIDEIADNIGRKWKDLARALDLKESHIIEIEERYPRSLKERAYQALLLYQETMKDRDQLAPTLLEALIRVRRVDLADIVEYLLLGSKIK